jgi:hypothetical protein
MGFAADLQKLCERAGDKAELVVRRTALELQSGMVEASPVRSGRFKNNWQVGVGAINTSTNDAADKSGSGSIGRTQVALTTWKPGQTIFLSNSLAYAKKLEDGSSTQAPFGVVRLTVQAYGDALRKAIAESK